MIDVIFPVYVADEENAALQRECFASFREHTPQAHRVIVVDNGSVCGREDAQEVADVYVRLPEPVGFARAVNTGWRLAEAPLACVANNDLVFLAGWLAPLLEALAGGDADIAAPVDDRMSHVPFWWSCFVMAAATRERLGFFDEQALPWRYHDQDYGIRALRAGLRFARPEASRVLHRESATWFKMPHRGERDAAERQVMLARWGAATAAEYQSASNSLGGQ
jgi:GT2 family glycosyltransferase